MTPNEIKEKTDTEISKLITDTKDELFRLKLKRSSGQLDKTHRIGVLKKDIARLLTTQKERQAKVN